jgi:hypothetical protein
MGGLKLGLAVQHNADPLSPGHLQQSRLQSGMGILAKAELMNTHLDLSHWSVSEVSRMKRAQIHCENGEAVESTAQEADSLTA